MCKSLAYATTDAVSFNEFKFNPINFFSIVPKPTGLNMNSKHLFLGKVYTLAFAWTNVIGLFSKLSNSLFNLALFISSGPKSKPIYSLNL